MTSQVLTRFIHAIWLGSGLFLILVAAPAAFRVAPNTTIAADVVGAMLSKWHYIAIIAPISLLLLDWKRARTSILAIMFVAVIFAALQGIVDIRIRGIRASSPIPISELSRQDPVRRQFGLLHGLSSLLLLGQVLCAATALAVDKLPYGARVSSPAPASSRAAGEDTRAPLQSRHVELVDRKPELPERLPDDVSAPDHDDQSPVGV